MRRALVVAGVLALAAPASASVGTRVWLPSENPIVVRGSGFEPNDRVVVKVTKAKMALRRVVVASAKGTFVTRWTRGLPTACGSTRVVAKGLSGRRDTWFAAADDCGPGDPR
jgi:hypothetical protein